MKTAPLLGLAVAAVLLVVDAGLVAAATRPLVALSMGLCSQVPAGEVQGMMAVELRRPVILFEEESGRDNGFSATTVVRVVCQGLRARIEIDDPLTGKTVERVVELATAAPVARPHLLALSVVELLAASWIELQSNPNSGGPDGGGGAAPESREAALDVIRRRPRARGARLLAAGTVQTSTSDLQSLGGALMVGGDPLPYLGWLVDLTLQHGEQTFALGRVTADTASALGSVLAKASWRGFAVRAGLGVRGGGAWMSGIPVDGSDAMGGSVRGRWWGPVALIDGSVIVAGRIVVELTVEGGRVILPVNATVEGAGPVAIGGNWIRGSLGVGFTL